MPSARLPRFAMACFACALGVLVSGCRLSEEPAATRVGSAAIITRPSAPAPPQAGGPYLYALEKIKSLKMTRGPEEWTEEIPIRLQGATWTFRRNGEFEFAPRMSREALFPVKGRYRVSGSQYELEGERKTNDDPSGHARVDVWGTVDFAGDVPMLTTRVRVTHGSGRVDPNDPISNINQMEYEAVIALKRE